MQSLPKIHLGHGSNGYFRRRRKMDPAGKRADGELLAMGKQLACAQPELASMLRWFDGVQELVAEEVLRRGTWPEDTAQWTSRDAAAYCAALDLYGAFCVCFGVQNGVCLEKTPAP
jgi:hypothetical protein